jgi:hypothetical protein
MGRRSQVNQIDWELIQRQYRLGQKSLRQIAVEFAVQPSAISRRAKKDGWVQDKSHEVRAISEAQLLLSNTGKATEKATPSRIDIEAAAQVRTDVILTHRRDIPAARKLAMSMFTELQLQTDGIELLKQLGELMAAPDEKGQDKRNELYLKVISLGGRASTLKSLADTLKTLVSLERQAFGIEDKEAAPTDALTSLLHGIASGNANGFRPVAQDPDHEPDEDD